MYGLRIIELVITKECNYRGVMWNEVFTESTLNRIRKWEPFPSDIFAFNLLSLFQNHIPHITMTSRPSIPERYSSLVPPSSLKDVEVLTNRSVSAKTTISQISTTSSTNDFIDAKTESISVDLAINSKFRDYFEGAQKRKAFTDEEYDDAIRELESEVNQKERELIT